MVSCFRRLKMFKTFILMTKETAEKVHKLAIDAISSLTMILNILPKDTSAEELNMIKRGIGTALGNIQIDLVEIITFQYPELDDLK